MNANVFCITATSLAFLTCQNTKQTPKDPTTEQIACTIADVSVALMEFITDCGLCGFQFHVERSDRPEKGRNGVGPPCKVGVACPYDPTQAAVLFDSGCVMTLTSTLFNPNPEASVKISGFAASDVRLCNLGSGCRLRLESETWR